MIDITTIVLVRMWSPEKGAYIAPFHRTFAKEHIVSFKKTSGKLIVNRYGYNEAFIVVPNKRKALADKLGI